MHKDSVWKENWEKFKETNPIVQGNITYCSVYRLCKIINELYYMFVLRTF